MIETGSPSLEDWLDGLAQGVVFNGDVAADAAALLLRHGREHTLAHCARVAGEARRLAERWGVNAAAAETAGWLHDISAVVPPNQRLWAAEQAGLEVLPEERQVPAILHQKLSVVLAKTLFSVSDPAVLSAIGCHTTLKAGASAFDQVVFLSDKLVWDQSGDPPYQAALRAALEHSLEAASLVFLNYLWSQRDQLPVLHPWTAAAYADLMQR
ncbi:MAG: bis(5'-nucleosyl)-tetraphosphatase (symmetrical) YqeK [Anaerolineae bacterium]|nr:bis(5'-nucleosyl)-tetraphosphatase (symmetrical) YqeK [Anaerolineae bacterium]